MLDPAIFKAYDIRAIYPQQIDKEGVYQIARAFLELVPAQEVVVGYDVRLSVPELLPELIQGLNDGGAKVINIGLTGTEVLYFTVGRFDYKAGIMLTASHDPKEYTGMKFVKRNAYPIGSSTGLFQIRDTALSKTYQRTNNTRNVELFDPTSEYNNNLEILVPAKEIKPMKIVVDASNGVGGRLFTNVYNDTNLDIVPINFEPDGNFPNHGPNPALEENLKELKEKVVSEKADLGIALDGDADRAVFIDERGRTVPSYYLIPILAGLVLRKYPSSKIVHENRLTWAIEDEVSAMGGTPVVAKPGHSFIKVKMREVDAVFGAESSSHFIFKDLYYAESSMMAVALILKLLSDSDQTLSEIIKPYRDKFFISGEINVQVANQEDALNKVRMHYEQKSYHVDTLDGVAVENDRNWRFSIRKSNTEPVIRLNVEASSQHEVDIVVNEVTNLIE